MKNAENIVEYNIVTSIRSDFMLAQDFGLGLALLMSMFLPRLHYIN